MCIRDSYYTVLDNNIGYINLSTFSGNPSKEFKQAFLDLKKRGMDRIPAARLPRMDTERPARGRLLYRGRESLSGENDAPATHQGHQDSPLRPGRIRNRRGPAEYVRRASPANIAIRMPSTPRVATPLFVSIRRQALPSSRSGLIPAVRKVKKRAVR